MTRNFSRESCKKYGNCPYFIVLVLFFAGSSVSACWLRKHRIMQPAILTEGRMQEMDWVRSTLYAQLVGCSVAAQSEGAWGWAQSELAHCSEPATGC